jgi:hypothetical protein
MAKPRKTRKRADRRAGITKALAVLERARTSPENVPGENLPAAVAGAVLNLATGGETIWHWSYASLRAMVRTYLTHAPESDYRDALATLPGRLEWLIDFEKEQAKDRAECAKAERERLAREEAENELDNAWQLAGINFRIQSPTMFEAMLAKLKRDYMARAA